MDRQAYGASRSYGSMTRQPTYKQLTAISNTAQPTPICGASGSCAKRNFFAGFSLGFAVCGRTSTAGKSAPSSTESRNSTASGTRDAAGITKNERCFCSPRPMAAAPQPSANPAATAASPAKSASHRHMRRRSRFLAPSVRKVLMVCTRLCRTIRKYCATAKKLTRIAATSKKRKEDETVSSCG